MLHPFNPWVTDRRHRHPSPSQSSQSGQGTNGTPRNGNRHVSSGGNNKTNHNSSNRSDSGGSSTTTTTADKARSNGEDKDRPDSSSDQLSTPQQPPPHDGDGSGRSRNGSAARRSPRDASGTPLKISSTDGDTRRIVLDDGCDLPKQCLCRFCDMFWNKQDLLFSTVRYSETESRYIAVY